MIHPTAIIGPNVTICERVFIGPYAVIGMHAESNAVDPRHAIAGRVVIGDDVTIHELVTVQGSAGGGATIIGDRCRLQAHSHVGHDAVLAPDVTVSCGAKVGGHAVLHAHCNVGLNAVLHQLTRLAEGTMVGASAFVKGEVIDPWTIVAGVPARHIGYNEVGKRRAHEQGH